MEDNAIQPVPVNGDEPTCLTAFLVMAQGVALDVSPEQARQVLSSAGVAWSGPALESEPGLERALSLLTHGAGGRQYV